MISSLFLVRFMHLHDFNDVRTKVTTCVLIQGMPVVYRLIYATSGNKYKERIYLQFTDVNQ